MHLRTLLTAMLIMATAAPAHALVINYNFVSGDTLTPAEGDAFATAASAWEAVLTDPITVNLSVGFTATLGTNILGSTIPTLYTASYPAVASLLKADAKTLADAQAVAALPATVTNNTILLTSAQIKAIGAASPASSDGSIQFNSSFNFADSRRSDGTIAANAYDLVGISEHEIGHLLGFISGLDFGNTESILDLFRYADSGAPSFVIGQPAYFSLDGGITDLAAFSTGSSDQASHWIDNMSVNGKPGLMDPEGNLGQVINITPLDTTALDVIGYDATPVPEPMALALLGPTVLACIILRRRAPIPGS